MASNKVSINDMDPVFSIEFHMPSGGFFSTFNLMLRRRLAKAKKDIANRLLNDAQTDHRYKHKTHKLKNATKVREKTYLGGGFDVELYVDESKADYSKYIIRGHGSWTPDSFIENAYKKNKDWIEKQIQDALDGSISQWNNS